MTGERESQIDTVLAYHERTKHHLHRYAASLGYMDWDTQPDPFRRYEGAALLPLDPVRPTRQPYYEQLFRTDGIDPRPMDRQSICRLFYDSLALSAWKQLRASRWSLRVNPSSGNLHPTEGYLISGPIAGLSQGPALFHYAPYDHALECRLTLSSDDWQALGKGLPRGSLLLGLTSIYWRESWKYGERGFRYCQHDVGHAIAAVALAASAMGWQARLLESAADDELAVLLGISAQERTEAEHADCLMVLWPGAEPWPVERQRAYRLPAPVLRRMRQAEMAGTPNRLSIDHHPWPLIDEVSDATRRAHRPPKAFWLRATPDAVRAGAEPVPVGARRSATTRCEGSARQIIRQRRSAVAMDGKTVMDDQTFFAMMLRVVPEHSPVPFATLPWPSQVALALFVHRVEGLQPGLYLLCRHDRQERSLRRAVTRKFEWVRPEGCPQDLNLYLLHRADCRRAARTVCCHQDIAADGAFAVAMLGRFDSTLRRFGAWFYKRLHWEAGAIGQILYLEAEAVASQSATTRRGLGATGIGCYFDDAMHQVLGIQSPRWQSFYHFTVGGPVEDPRLQTIPAYDHLRA